MLKLTTCFVCTWSTCEFIMKVDAAVCTHTQSQATGVERVLFVWKDLAPSHFSSHISPPPPPFPFSPLLCFPHILSTARSLTSLKQLLWSSLLSTFLKYRFISLYSSPFDNCSFSPLLLVCYPLPCPDTNFHTDTQIRRNVRNVSVPAASCCCYTYDCNPRTPGVRVFFQPMDGRMDGWRHRMIDEEVGQCWPSP